MRRLTDDRLAEIERDWAAAVLLARATYPNGGKRLEEAQRRAARDVFRKLRELSQEPERE